MRPLALPVLLVIGGLAALRLWPSIREIVTDTVRESRKPKDLFLVLASAIVE